MTTKRIICPYCRIAHKPGEGYYFNEQLSLICDNCNKTIFPATEVEEVGLPKAADQRYSGYYRDWQNITFA